MPRRSSIGRAQSRARASRHWLVDASVYSATRRRPTGSAANRSAISSSRSACSQQRIVASSAIASELVERVDRHELDAGRARRSRSRGTSSKTALEHAVGPRGRGSGPGSRAGGRARRAGRSPRPRCRRRPRRRARRAGLAQPGRRRRRTGAGRPSAACPPRAPGTFGKRWTSSRASRSPSNVPTRTRPLSAPRSTAASRRRAALSQGGRPPRGGGGSPWPGPCTGRSGEPCRPASGR